MSVANSARKNRHSIDNSVLKDYSFNMSIPQDKRNRVYAYVARYPFDVIGDYIPLPRKQEIDSCGSAEVANAKYYSFKLLEIALKQAYGVDMRDCVFTRDANGKWPCSECQISLSHSGNVVAVALSDMPVGIDIERFNPARFGQRLQARIFTPAERDKAATLNTDERKMYANRLWTVKEALFKLDGGKVFVANDIDAESRPYFSAFVTADVEYCLTVVSSCVKAEIEYNALNVTVSGFKCAQG